MRHELPDKLFEGGSGWVIQSVPSRASFRRQPLSGQKNLHSSVVASNSYAQKRQDFFNLSPRHQRLRAGQAGSGKVFYDVPLFDVNCSGVKILSK